MFILLIVSVSDKSLSPVFTLVLYHHTFSLPRSAGDEISALHSYSQVSIYHCSYSRISSPHLSSDNT